jgi:hypothetical protein
MRYIYSMSRFSCEDGNQSEIVAALKDMGWSVHITGQVGNGFPDLAIGVVHGGKRYNVLLEVKNPKNSYGRGPLSPKQQLWHDTWKGQVAIVRTPGEAIRACLEACPA